MPAAAPGAAAGAQAAHLDRDAGRVERHAVKLGGVLLDGGVASPPDVVHDWGHLHAPGGEVWGWRLATCQCLPTCSPRPPPPGGMLRTVSRMEVKSTLGLELNSFRPASSSSSALYTFMLLGASLATALAVRSLGRSALLSEELAKQQGAPFLANAVTAGLLRDVEYITPELEHQGWINQPRCDGHAPSTTTALWPFLAGGLTLAV